MRKIYLLLLLLVGITFLSAQAGFDIVQFSDSTKYGWMDWRQRAEYRTELLERQKLLQIYEMEANSMRGNIIKSALAPGWGQFSNKQNTKGSIFLATELLLVGASLYFYDRSLYYYDKYQSATQVEQIETYYNAATGPRQYSLIFLGVGLVVWGYNLFDVIQGTDDYNAAVWRRVVENYANRPVQITPTGVEIRF